MTNSIEIALSYVSPDPKDMVLLLSKYTSDELKRKTTLIFMDNLIYHKQSMDTLFLISEIGADFTLKKKGGNLLHHSEIDFRHCTFGGKMADNEIMQKYPAFDRHNIPYSFEYTERLVSLLMRIAETKPYIEQYIGKPLEVHLLRQAKILAITYSNQIEGNKLEVRGVTRILEDGDLETSDKDVLEIRNYCDALEYLVSRIYLLPL